MYSYEYVCAHTNIKITKWKKQLTSSIRQMCKEVPSTPVGVPFPTLLTPTTSSLASSLISSLTINAIDQPASPIEN
uniref:Ovule protein n=1 Tax=Caenorhabditis tropicalis TaxID=1561998 RepID=A0A1I7TXJ0_9PELO